MPTLGSYPGIQDSLEALHKLCEGGVSLYKDMARKECNKLFPMEIETPEDFDKVAAQVKKLRLSPTIPSLEEWRRFDVSQVIGAQANMYMKCNIDYLSRDFLQKASWDKSGALQAKATEILEAFEKFEVCVREASEASKNPPLPENPESSDNASRMPRTSRR